MFRFPFGTVQELNLDWFLEQWEIFKTQAREAFEGIDHALDDEIDRVEDAMSDLYAARDAAIAAKTAAETAESSTLGYAQSAANSAASAAGSATGSAQSASSSAGSAQQAAQSAQTSAQQASSAATSAGNASTSASNASTSAATAANNATISTTYSQESAAWATGSYTGDPSQYPVPSTAPQHENNAKYYADAAANSATAAAGSATAAAGSATAAAGSATDAAASAASVSASAAQIAQNASDIDAAENNIIDIKNQIIARNATKWFNSLNNNYLDSTDINISGKYFGTTTGNLLDGENYSCGYIMLPGAGTYQLFQSTAQLGTARNKIPIYHADKTFYKSLSATEIDNYIIEFVISEEDAKEAVYVGVCTRLLSDPLPMLVLNANYPSDRIYRKPQYVFNSALLQTSIKAAQELKQDQFVSLSGSIFDYENATWLDGIDQQTGSVNPETGYHYAFARLQGAGNYIREMRTGSFGVLCSRIALYDINKNFIKTLTATRVGETHGYAFTLSESDALLAAYVTINKRDAYPDYIGLYYNTTNFPQVGSWQAALPKYGSVSNPLYKKILVCDGDSICKAALDLPFSVEGYFGRLKNDFSMIGKNYAVSGGAITEGLTMGDNPRHSVCESLDTIISEYPTIDFLILEGGTNDADLIGQFSGDTPPEDFGTWSESDFSGSYTTTTFCGAVDSMFYKAVTNYPTAKIGFIIAMQMGTNNNTVANRRRYFDEIKKIAKKWHVPVLDLWENIHTDARLTAYYDSTKTEAQNREDHKFYNDGQHPTSYGYNFMQSTIEEWMQNL